MSNKSLYERIGGETAISQTVIKLYDKILDDPELSPFFENIDVDRLRNSQKAFVTLAFGGNNHYTGKNLRASHQNSVKNGLNNKHFDLVVMHLTNSMRELGVSEELIKEATDIVETTRTDVLCL